MYDKKIFFGKVNPLLAIEHLAATRSLSDLQEVFEGTIDAYLKSANEEMFWPPAAPIDLHQRLRETAADKFSDVLYSEQKEMQASLLLMSQKLYQKGVLLLVDHPSEVD